MQVRLAFMGFNPTCARLVGSLASSGTVGIVGILAPEVPPQWPSDLDPPRVFANLKELFGSGKPDLLVVAEDAGDLKGVPSGCQVLHVQEGSPLAALLGSLPLGGESGASLQDDVREIASICSSINVIGAYSDPVPKLAQLLDRAMAISGSELGMVLMPGEAVEALKVILARGEGVELMVGRDFSVASSLCGRAFDAGEAFHADLEGESEEARCLEGKGLRSFLAMPLRAEGRVVGVLALGREESAFEPTRMPLLALIADQAALAVQISRLYSELETNVVMDAVSGLFNQRYFHQRVSEEISRARRYSLNVCLVVLEIDGFDDYIRRNGRFMGEFILSDVGKIIKRNTREVDTAARYGDKVFAVLLPETRRLGAMRFAERIRKVMEEYPFPSRERKEVEKLTVCAGISSFPANADSADSLLDKAFRSLTAAKTDGPNNIRLYASSMDEEVGA